MLRLLGILAGILSLVILAWKGFDFSFGPFFSALFEFYEREAHAFFNLIEPTLAEMLRVVASYVGWQDVHLYPHWKHAFVLLWLYFGAIARTAWQGGYRGTAIYEFVWGGIIALAASALAGTVALNDPTSNIAMAFWPVAGAIIFSLGEAAWGATFFRDPGASWSSTFLGLSTRVLFYYVIPGAIILGIGTQASAFGVASPSLGLYVLFGLLVAVAIQWLWRGRFATGSGETYLQRYLGDADTKIGADILSVIGGASLTVLLGMAGV